MILILRFIITLFILISFSSIASPNTSEYKLLLKSIDVLKKEVKRLNIELLERERSTPHSNSEYRLLLTSVTALEQNVRIINRDLVIFGHSVTSNENLQHQISTLEKDITSLHSKISELPPIDTSKFASTRQIKDIDSSIDKIKKDSISHQLFISENTKTKQETLREAKRESDAYHNSDITRIFTILGIAFTLIAWTLDRYYKGIIQEKIEGYDSKFKAFLEETNTLATAHRARESFKNASIYMNIAASIYFNRFLTLPTLQNPSIEQATKHGILFEIISIQTHAVDQLKDILNSYDKAKALYSVSCLELAYYICEFKVKDEPLEQDKAAQISSLLNKGRIYESDWLENELRLFREGKNIEKVAQTIIEYNDNKQFITTAIGLTSNVTPEESVNKILESSLNSLRESEHDLEHQINNKFNVLREELLEIYKNI